MVAVMEGEAMTRQGGRGCQCGRKRRGVFPFERVIFRAKATAAIPDSIPAHFKMKRREIGDSQFWKFRE